MVIFMAKQPTQTESGRRGPGHYGQYEDPASRQGTTDNGEPNRKPREQRLPGDPATRHDEERAPGKSEEEDGAPDRLDPNNPDAENERRGPGRTAVDE
jgi:hypothetical protein